MRPDHIPHMKWVEMSYIVDITQAPCIYYIHHYCSSLGGLEYRQNREAGANPAQSHALL